MHLKVNDDAPSYHEICCAAVLVTEEKGFIGVNLLSKEISLLLTKDEIMKMLNTRTSSFSPIGNVDVESLIKGVTTTMGPLN